MIQLLDLPAELLARIFAYLPLDSLTRLLCTSQHLNGLIASSSLLQYSLWLQSSSYSCHQPDIPAADALEQLTELEMAWSEWKLKKRTRLELPRASHQRDCGISDIGCGIFILDEIIHGPTTHDHDLIWVDLTDQDLRWRRCTIESHLIDLALNVPEDLIAVVTYKTTETDSYIIELHLLQLSASTESMIKHHPMASQPVLPILSYPTSHNLCKLFFGMVGTCLALLIIFPCSDFVDRLYVFNWKTGQMLFVRLAERSTHYCLTFLSEDILVLPNCITNSLEFCSFSRSREACDSSVTAFDDECRELHPDFPFAIPLRTLVTLRLPRLAPDVQVSAATCRGEPSPYSCSNPARVGENRLLFRPQPESCIVIFNLGIDIGLLEAAYPTFIVHRDALLAQMNKFADRLSSPAAMDGVPWTEWGPAITRWFRVDDDRWVWFNNNCGQRWISMKKEEPSSIFIRDFNPNNVNRVIGMLGGKGSYETENAVITVFNMPSSLPDEGSRIFEEHVESKLPYLELKTKEKFSSYTTLFIDDYSVLGFVPDENNFVVDLFFMK